MNGNTMTEKQMEFRVGLFVVVAVGVAAFMVFHFSELKESLATSRVVTVHFRDAAGIHKSSPVQMSGIEIGTVRDIQLDEQRGGVLVRVSIRPEYTVRQGSRARIVTSLLGDATIDFSPGVGTPAVDANTLLSGLPPSDPMQAVNRLENKLGAAVDVLTQTGREWQQVGSRLNTVMGGQDGEQMQRVLRQTVASLEQFTRTMHTANKTLSSAQQLLADGKTQSNLKETLQALPKLVEDTRQTIGAVRGTVQRVDQNLQHIDTALRPIAQNSRPMASRLNNTLANLEVLSAELAQFSKLLRTRDGSVQRLVADPSLYRNLNATAASMATFLQKAEPVLSDLRVFSDKIARHPELIGVRGVLRGSSGVKQVDYEEPRK